jgi:cysteine-rich repeat protein
VIFSMVCGCGPVLGAADDHGATGGFDAEGDSGASSTDDGSEVDDGVADTGEVPVPECGDAIVDAGEACDDGNGADGDGCNRDCLPSGQLLWSDRYDAGRSDYAHRVAIDRFGGLRLAVTSVDDTDRQRVALRSYASDGLVLWHTDAPISDEHYQIALGLALEESGVATVAILASSPTSAALAQLVQLDADGGVAWSARYDPIDGSTTPLGLAIDGAGRVLFASVESPLSAPPTLRLEAFDGEALVWQTITALAGVYPSDFVATGSAGSVVSTPAQVLDEGVGLWRFTDEGAVEWHEQMACGRVIATDAAGTTWAAGPDELGNLAVCSMDPSGEAGASVVLAAPGFDLTAMSIAEGGDLLLVGYSTGSLTGMRVERRALAGEVRWSFTPNGTAPILPFSIASGVDRIAVSGTSLDGSTDAVVYVLTP